MLVHRVHADMYAYMVLFPYKRSLQPVGPSSFTLLGWFRLPPIDQYSSLLPPVGVWTVSQFQCGGNASPSGIGKLLSPQTHAGKRRRRGLISLSEGYTRMPGRLDTRYSPVRRSPPSPASWTRAAPRLACVKPVASVHPEPGSNSPL